MKKRFKIYRKMMWIDGKKKNVLLKSTNEKMKFYEMFDQMVHDFGVESIIKQTMTSAYFEYKGGQ